MVGYSTQSKGYRVYNKRTRLIVESIHIKFDEIKEMMSDHNSSDLAPQRQEMSVENVSSGLVPQGQKASDYDNSDPVPPRQNVVPTAEKTDSSHQGLEFLFSPLLEEYYNPTHGLAEENNNDQAPNASFQEAEFINPFCTRVQEIGESSSRNIDNTDVHSFQPQSHDYRWTRDHPLEQVRGNPTMPVQTRRQLATDPEMCMFALTVSIVEPKNIKEAMADSAWIEAMQDELHQFDRLKVWELVDKPFGKMIIKLKWLWKNKKDEDQTVIRNKARLVAKGYAQEEASSKCLASHALEFWKKHNMDNCHSIGTPLATKTPNLDVDLSGEPVDQSGLIVTAFSDAVIRCLDTRKKHIWRDTVLWCFITCEVGWMSKKETKLPCNSLPAERQKSFGRYLLKSWCSSNVDIEDTELQDYGFNYNKIQHPSDTNVFTMKMEILLEPASNKLLVGQTVVTVSQSTKVDSLPHVHAHSTKTIYHESSRFKDKDAFKNNAKSTTFALGIGGTRDHVTLRMRAAYSSAMAARNLSDFLALSRLWVLFHGVVVVVREGVKENSFKNA
ncbi:retrovirus-related pol polyprotein from transposon TNT 1-94 [Tanacetum coccineum]